MLFIEWKPVVTWIIAVLVAALCLFGFRIVRTKRLLPRRLVRSSAVFLLIVDAFFVYLIVDSGKSYSNAVFSPDGKMAARVAYTDYWTERNAEVEVFREHGFSHETVYGARPLLTEKEIHWLDAKNIWLAGLDPFFCRSTDFVAVHCGAANSPAAPNVSIPIVIYVTIDPQAQAPSRRQDPPSESRSAR